MKFLRKIPHRHLNSKAPHRDLYHRLVFWFSLISVLFGASVCEAGLKIYYIRHAEGGHNVTQDWIDSGIPEEEWPDYVGDPNQFTPLGKTQQEAVSAKLQELEYRFDFIAASALWRTQNTILPYMKEVGSMGEVWPELNEMSIGSEFILADDLPEITDPILGQGGLINLPAEEAEWFSLRPDGLRNPSIPDYGTDEASDAAAKIIVIDAAIDLILERFDGTDQAILLAGHGASGKSIIRRLTNDVDADSIENTGIWMVEQQSDGTFKRMMYNSVFLEGSGGGGGGGPTTVRFDDLRADLSDGEINGKTASDSNVTITSAADGDDIVYSLSIENQDFDGIGGSNDSLSWDIRFEGFIGGSFTENGNDSSVSLGSSSQVYMSDAYFGVSDNRYVDPDDSIQFTVENVVLTAAGGTTVQFNGFDGIYGSDDTYVFGVGGSGLESLVTIDDDDFTFTPTTTLTLSCPTDKFRVRDLTGSFTVTSTAGVGFNSSWISKPYGEDGAAYNDTLAGTASGDSLIFSKVSGPTWLTVATDGSLSGTPGASDVGSNVFKVQVENASGATDTMTLVIVVQAASPTTALSGDDLNYTFLYYENGYPGGIGRRPSSEDNLLAEANPDLVVQTGYYSLMLDCDDMELEGYDTRTGSGYLEDLEEDVTVFTPAGLTLAVTKDGVEYTCTGADMQASGGQVVRLIESNRYVQRFDHLGLIFEDSSGNVLAESGRFEMTAWADRVAFKLDFSGVAGVTETSVKVVSPLSVVHENVVTGDSAVLAIQPHLDTTLSAWNVNDYVTEATVLGSATALNVEFDADEYALHIDVASGGVSYPRDVDRVDEFVVEITNPGISAENIPLIFAQPSPRAITGTVMTMCEEADGRPLGIPVQISKNWHKDTENPTVHQGSWLRGYTMLHLAAGETKRFRLRVIFGYWGGAGAISHSQLSLIGWGKNWKWDESALGAWGESCTYDPTMHAGGAFMADIRPAFTQGYTSGTAHSWTENSGGGDNLIYRDSSDTYRHVKRVKTAYRWVGPNMTEVLYSGVTDDDKIRYTYTTRAVRTNDYHRRFHGYKYEFLQDVTSPTRLVFHQMAADFYDGPDFTDYHIGAELGLLSSGTAIQGNDVYSGTPTQFNHRWLAIDDTITGVYSTSANRGILSLSSTLNGTWFPLYLHTYGNDGDSMMFDLSSDSVANSYAAGDTVEGEVEFVMPPKTSALYWGSDAELIGRLDAYGSNAWEAVHDEFRYNVALDVTVDEGTLQRNYPIEIQASTTSDEILAEFTINGGGIGHVPVVVKGIEPGLALHAQRFIDGFWVPLETTNLDENDDHQAYLNAQGTMDAVFNIPRPSLDLEESWSIRIVSGFPNYAPVAESASAAVVVDGSVTITLSGSDINGDVLTYTVLTAPANGTLSGTEPNLTYTPNAGFNGTDSFTFIANDGAADSAVATVSIDVFQAIVVYEHTAGSALPSKIATGASSSVSLGGMLSGDVATSIDQYSAGNGIILNIADTDYNYYFVYTVSGPGLITYKSLEADIYAKDADRTYRMSYSIGGGAETFITSGQVPTGDLTDEGNFDVYDFADFTTSATVEFRVYWQGSASATSNSRVYVDDLILKGAVNQVPVADAKSVSVDGNSSVEIALSGSDPEGSDLSYAVVTGPSNGSLSGTAPNLTYTPNANYYGADSFTFTVNDGTTDSAAATVAITVNAPDYNSWLNLYPALTDVTAQDDPEGDGLENLLEYVLNGDPTAADTLILPELDASGENFVFSFTRRVESADDTTQVFQYSSTLQADDWTNVSITNPKAVEVAISPAVDGLQGVTVTISKSVAVDEKLFGRLKVVIAE